MSALTFPGEVHHLLVPPHTNDMNEKPSTSSKRGRGGGTSGGAGGAGAGGVGDVAMSLCFVHTPSGHTGAAGGIGLFQPKPHTFDSTNPHHVSTNRPRGPATDHAFNGLIGTGGGVKRKKAVVVFGHRLDAREDATLPAYLKADFNTEQDTGDGDGDQDEPLQILPRATPIPTGHADETGDSGASSGANANLHGSSLMVMGVCLRRLRLGPLTNAAKHAKEVADDRAVEAVNSADIAEAELRQRGDTLEAEKRAAQAHDARDEAAAAAAAAAAAYESLRSLTVEGGGGNGAGGCRLVVRIEAVPDDPESGLGHLSKHRRYCKPSRNPTLHLNC